MLNAKANFVKDNSVGGKIRNTPQVNVTAVTAEPGAVGTVKRRRKLNGMVTDGNREFLTESVRPTSGEYVDFFKFDEDYRLIILGAISVMESESGLFIDCTTEEEWLDPELVDGILTIRQAHSIRQTDTVLEVR